MIDLSNLKFLFIFDNVKIIIYMKFILDISKDM